MVLAAAWLAGGTLALAGHHLIAMPVLLGVAAGALAIMLWDRRAALLVAAVLGAMWTTHVAAQALAARLSPALEGRTIVVTGRIANLPQVQPGRVRFQFTVAMGASTSGRALKHPSRIALSWYRPHAARLPRTGERWRFAVRLRRPRGLADPGVFDYAGWALAHGIGASGYVYHNRAEWLAPAGAGLGPLRAHIARAIAEALPANPYAGLVAGLAVGERGGMSEAQWRTLRATGTTHLLAISGLHLGLVAALVFFLVLMFVRRIPSLIQRIPARVIAVGAAALAAVGYAALAGFSLATERALIMLVLPLFALVLRRRIAVADALAFAAIVVSLYT
ncbi:MAG: ComEC/Rec2 family competence protein, partial [Gammaproteobacteria bacterium]